MDLSVSKIDVYGCPKRYKLRHVDKIAEKKHAYMLCGDSIHKAMEAGAKGEDPIKAFADYIDKNEDNFKTCTWADKAPRNDLKVWVDYATWALQSYFISCEPYVPLMQWGEPYVEKYERVKVDGLDVIALKIDLVTQDDVIVDHKTAGKSLSKKDIEDYQTSFQTRLYSWAFEQLHGRPPQGTMYDFFILNKTPKFDRTPVLLHNPADMPLVESMIKEYSQNIYWNHQTNIWPRDFSHCFDFGKKCDFWNHCHTPTESEGLAAQVEIISGDQSKLVELW